MIFVRRLYRGRISNVEISIYLDLNLIDWGKASNMIAVALLNCVFLWDDNTENVTKLLELPTNDNDEEIQYISSVSWHNKAPYLAIGTSYQQVHIYDVKQQICKRKLINHNMLEEDDRIPCLAWNQNIIAWYYYL
jgi:WD40 repeat protein